MRISIVGAGYVGLVSGAGLAEVGHQVICVDRKPEVVAAIMRGETPIYEPGLSALLTRHGGQRLTATSDLRSAVLTTDLTLIAVGTPFNGDRIDLAQIEEAARVVGSALRDKPDWHIVGLKSTAVPGTTDEVLIPLLELHSGKKAGRDFGVGTNPEFLREGEAVNDFLYPDRIVIGSSDSRTAAGLESVYASFTNASIVRTNSRTAETIKYTMNSLLATMISLSNEIGNICAALPDVDVEDVMRGVHLDGRLSPTNETGQRIRPGFLSYLRAGCGFGGSCFPKDVNALVAHAARLGIGTPVLKATMLTNSTQPMQLLARLKQHYPSLAGLPVAVLGLAYKPNTDDTRESPAIPIVHGLISNGAIVSVFDPIVPASTATAIVPGARIASSLPDVIAGAQAIILVTSSPEFLPLPDLIAGVEPAPLVLDGRRMYSAGRFARYDGIGYPFSAAPAESRAAR